VVFPEAFPDDQDTGIATGTELVLVMFIEALAANSASVTISVTKYFLVPPLLQPLHC